MIDPTDASAERRLRAADPAPSGRPLPSGRTLSDLVEATMSHDLESTPTASKPRRWPWIGIAAAVIAALLAGGIYLVARDDPAGRRTASGPGKTVLTLSLPEPATGPTMHTCIQFSVRTLAPMQVAFSGTVTSTERAAVTMTVDHWYRGGNAEEVRLTVPNPPTPTTAEGLVELSRGHRYLVTATDGVVTTCGFTTEWSPAAAATFRTAFER